MWMIGRFLFLLAFLATWGNYSKLLTQEYHLKDAVRFIVEGTAITILIVIGWAAMEIVAIRRELGRRSLSEVKPQR